MLFLSLHTLSPAHIGTKVMKQQVIMNHVYFQRFRYALEWLFYFTRYFFRQFYQHRGLQIASSLAYATLLSLVPLVTVMFGFLGGLPVFDKIGDTVQTFIFNNFVPTFGGMIQSYLTGFSQKASQLTVTGLSVLFIIALMLMATIENALNSIWHVHDRRNPAARFLVYWAILSLGPVLLGIGLFSTTYLLSLPLVAEVGGTLGLQKKILSFLPFLTTSIAFTLMYVLIPNCFVYKRHALTGGIIAAVLFELAKHGFGFYVKEVATYETIYGTLAAIPVFLIWIYTSWVILILGAHITFCLSSFRFAKEKSGSREHDWTFEDAYHIIALLWLGQKDGKVLSFIDLRKQGIKIPQHQANEIVQYLSRAGWVETNSDGCWLLARDLDNLSILDLHRIIPKPMPVDKVHNIRDGGVSVLMQVVTQYQESLRHNLSVPLAKMLREDYDEKN